LALPRDVTAQKVSEDALRDAMRFNRAIIQDAGEGIIVYDHELRYKVFNPFMERLTGKCAEEVLGKIAMEVFPRLRTSGVEMMSRSPTSSFPSTLPKSTTFGNPALLHPSSTRMERSSAWSASSTTSPI